MNFSNFFSLKEDVCVDFRPGVINSAGGKALSGHVFSANDEKFLKVLGIFGPNASGKSNILKAANFCRRLVLDSYQNNEGVVFDFMPFKFDDFLEKPSSFSISFIADGTEYEYSFSITRNQIVSEELYYYPGKRKAKIFTRNECAGMKKSEQYSFSEGLLAKPMDVAQSTGKNTLFISRASQMDRELAKKIYNFFRTELLIGLPRLSGKDSVELFSQNKDLVLKALRLADSDIADIRVRIDKMPLPIGNETRLTDVVNFYTTHKRSLKVRFHLEGEESAGTIQLFNLLLTLLDVCKNGKTLLLDEFDLSLHSETAQFVLDLVNVSDAAQFLFTSHNTSLINVKKLRRDQILFANKKEDGSTELYSLFDFKDFRENMDAEKCYLKGRFDAIPYIDSSLSKIKDLFRKE